MLVMIQTYDQNLRASKLSGQFTLNFAHSLPGSWPFTVKKIKGNYLIEIFSPETPLTTTKSSPIWTTDENQILIHVLQTFWYMYVASHWLSFHPYFFVLFYILILWNLKEIKFDPKPMYQNYKLI